MRLQIDKEFESLCPPLTPDEQSSLESRLLKEGCRDPLVVWKGHHILLDGHNRFRLCQKHAIPFRTVQEEVADRESARNWIIKNQLSRRNITSEAAGYLRGNRYNRLKQARGGDRKSEKTRGQDVLLIDVAEYLASEYGLSARTIRRDGQLADAVDMIVRRCGQEDVKQLLLGRDTDLSRKIILQLTHLNRSELLRQIDHLRKTGKLPRKRKQQGDKVESPRALAGVLMHRLGRRKAKTLYQELGRLLSKEGEGTRLIKDTKRNGHRAN